MIIQENYSLKKLNTFGIDASARYFSGLSSVEDILEILSEPIFANTQKLILGGGGVIYYLLKILTVSFLKII